MTEKSPTEITMEKIRAEWEAPLRTRIQELEKQLEDAMNNRVSGSIWRASQVDMRNLKDRLATIHKLMTAVHETTLGQSAELVVRILEEVTRLSANGSES